MFRRNADAHLPYLMGFHNNDSILQQLYPKKRNEKQQHVKPDKKITSFQNYTKNAPNKYKLPDMSDVFSNKPFIFHADENDYIEPKIESKKITNATKQNNQINPVIIDYENTCTAPPIEPIGDTDQNHYHESIKRSRTASLSFKRKYIPRNFEADSEIVMRPNKMEKSEDSVASAEMYESRVDKILKIINTAENDYRENKLSARKMSLRPHKMRSPTIQSMGPNHTKIIQPQKANYSYYALIFMMLSNVMGVLLTLSFQGLMFLKINANMFLDNVWRKWQNLTVLQFENNIISFVMMMPLAVIIFLCYGFMWTAFAINSFLLMPVPDRIADLVTYNFDIY